MKVQKLASSKAQDEVMDALSHGGSLGMGGDIIFDGINIGVLTSEQKEHVDELEQSTLPGGEMPKAYHEASTGAVNPELGSANGSTGSTGTTTVSSGSSTSSKAKA